ncbi:formylglycine-generating enzyme family protein [Treponema sp.]|uniref:formylglycine-generating enzyme family protein n=1 Tax=Treponema sp. TaxID=166 RepID=UPI00298D7254|nr:SUMF1/EgtB/PvdO family nonheme iron enzyme [Treponema sp.]MCR5614083.1 formylglycine-generating enzyme family protein [Treponema sp.]
MLRKNGMNQFRLLVVAACVAVLGGNFAFSKPKSDLVKEEAGFYYGYGKASSTEDADFMARRDLVENALTATVRLTDPAAQKVSVSDEVVKERLGDIKAFAQSKNGQSVVYRMRVSEWERNEKTYAEKLRAKLTLVYNNFSAKQNLAEKINLGVQILSELAKAGETDLLTLQEKGTELFSRKVESMCTVVAENIVFSFSVKDSIINSSTSVVVSAKDKAGKPLAGLKIKAVWEVPYVAVISEETEVSEVLSVLTTDAKGNATADYPVADEYKNRVVTLTVSTAFSAADYVSKEMRVLDGVSATEARYYSVEDVKEAYKSVAVPAGEFEAGALANDARATSKEASRKVKLAAYEIDVAPVTNFQYAVYLYLTRAEENPEYLDNDDYSKPNQPVIGVTSADAENYAKWLSAQTGEKYRLPSDDEWEKAARAGLSVIYPWGDDDPSKGKKANYKGNGKFKLPSPVGSFDAGVNAWGLVDMAGNVWEWTSGTRGVKGSTNLRTVKGGSWMDGPVDLRISNFKNIDGTTGYPDVGFRLVKEASK